MANSEGQSPPSGQADFNLWGMLDGLIDRLIHEGAALPYANKDYQLPNHSGHKKCNAQAHDKLTSTYQLHQYSNDTNEVSNHHRKVTEKVRRARSLFEPVSPYVLRHKHISELLDILPKDQDKIEKKKRRRLKKFRAKPFREISDWGLTDSDTDGDSDEGPAESPGSNENAMVLGEGTHDSLDRAQSQALHGVSGDSAEKSIPKSDEDLRANDTYTEKKSEPTSQNAVFEKNHPANNTGDVSTYDFTPQIEDLHLDNIDILGELDIPSQDYAQDLSIGRQGQTDTFYGGESHAQHVNDFTNVNNAQNMNTASGHNTAQASNVSDFTNVNNAQNRNIASGHYIGLATRVSDFTNVSNVHNGNINSGHCANGPGDISDALKQDTDLSSWNPPSQHNSHPQHSQYYTETVHTGGLVYPNDGGQFDLSNSQKGHTYECHMTQGQDEDRRRLRDESSLHTKDEIGVKVDNQRQEESHQRQPMNRDLIVEIGDVGQDEMDYILETLLRAQRNFKNVIPAISQTEFQQKMDEYMERKKAELGADDVTVTEADAKRVTLLEHVIKYFEKKIVEIVKFAKCIPGFQTLGVDDQANLIKVSRTESGLVGGVGVSLKEGVVKAENESNIPLDMIGSVVGPQYMKEVYRVTSKIDSVKITEKEGALLRGITITYTDRCKLNEPEKVQSIQNKLVTCLMRVVEEESTEVSTQVRMGQLVEVLTTLRNYTDADSNLLQNALNKYPNYSSNDLVKEFLEPHQ